MRQTKKRKHWRKRKLTRWYFGYNGNSEHYHEVARSYANLVERLRQLGMEPPDWHEDSGISGDELFSSD